MPLEVQIEKKLRDFLLEVSFTAGDGPLSVLGLSGVGKTMLLRCIAGLDPPDKGFVKLNGRVLLDTEKRVHVPARGRRIGMLFQHYALFPHLTVAENIAFGLRDLPSDERSRRIASVVERTHILGLENRYPQQISGGEQQRAALARALATEPEALLLDEPLSALDTHLRSQMEAQLEETFAAYGHPTLLVTHNIEEAYRLSEQLLVLARGRVAAFGPKEEIFRHPPTLEVARLTGCKNFSRVRPVSNVSGAAGATVEALDWNCTLQIAHPIAHSIAQPPAYIGIRAHHINFADPATGTESKIANVFPCWPVRVSETPFRVTLYLNLHHAPQTGSARDDASEYHLQAEVFKEKWDFFRNRPTPWHVRLSPDSLFLLPE